MKKQIQPIKQTLELIKEPMLAFLAATLIICFIISHTRVPTESMQPTISPGDHLIVNRLPYYYRDPVRGEVVVFVFGEDYLIKRVIGEPGDEINIVADTVYVNGKPLDETAYLAPETKTYIFAGSEITFPYIVPENTYFVMGDNRINSKDSRIIGPIPRDKIIAKAGLRIYPLQDIARIK